MLAGRTRSPSTTSTATMPRANARPEGPTTSTVSTRHRTHPRAATTPAGSRLRGWSVNARSAPSSTSTTPSTSAANAIHSLRAGRRPIVGGERGADAGAVDRTDEHIGGGRPGDHAPNSRPRRDLGGDELARHAAAAPAAAATVGGDRQHRVVGGRRARRASALGVAPRIGGVDPVGVGQQHEQVGADRVGHQRGEPVVVAVAELVVGDRVVLVDHRNAARAPAAGPGSDGRAGTGSDRRSRADRAAPAPRRGRGGRTGRCRPRRAGSARRPRPPAACVMSVGRAARPTATTPAATAPDETTITWWPARRRTATSSHSFGDRGDVDHAAVVGDRRRADLGDDPHQRSGW